MRIRVVDNVFDDGATGKRFVIQYSRPLTRDEMVLTIRRWIADEKTILFNLWRRRPENRNWAGNVEAKREQIFAEDLAERDLVLVGGGVATLAIVEDFAARMLNESEAINLPLAVLERRGLDVTTLASLLVIYLRFPSEERQFAFENVSPAGWRAMDCGCGGALAGFIMHSRTSICAGPAKQKGSTGPNGMGRPPTAE